MHIVMLAILILKNAEIHLPLQRYVLKYFTFISLYINMWK